MTVVSSVLLFFLVSIFAMPLPVGVPPLPADPALLRVAPRDTMVYVEWFGAADPDPNSRNKTEALFAETEVQQMLRGIISAIRASAVREARGNEIAGELFDLGKLALRRPGCFFLSRLDLPPKPFSIQAGLVINVGEEAQNVKLTLRKMESLMVSSFPAGMAIETKNPAPVDGVQFRSLPMASGPMAFTAPPVSWAVVDDYLVLAMGEDAPAEIVRGLRTNRPGLNESATFNELHGQVKVARPCMRSFVDVARILQMASAAGGIEVATALKATGLADLRALISESGLEAQGFTARSLIATSGRSGLLKFLEGPPLTFDDLAIVPHDSTFAHAFRVNPLGYYRSFMELFESVDPDAADEFEDDVLDEIEDEIDLDIDDDILAHLGNTLTMWNSPGQGGLLVTGFTAALSLKNPAAFRRTFTELMAQMAEGAPRKERSSSGRISRNIYLEQTEHRGQRIYFLNAIGEEMPFAPAWCLTDTHLLFSLFPQTLKTTLDREQNISTSLGRRKELLTGSTLAVSYLDARRTFKTLYPVAHILANLMFSELQREGLDVNISLLPTAPSILPYLGAEFSSFSSTDNGFLLERHGTLPLADAVMGGLGMPMLMALPTLLVASTTRAAPMIQEIRPPQPMAPGVERAPMPPEVERAEPDRVVPPPVRPPADPEQRWLSYEINSVEQVFDPKTETEPVAWPEYVTVQERREVESLLDRVRLGGEVSTMAKTRLAELGHKSLAGIVNRLREVDYTDASQTAYAHELNKVIEKTTITINAAFQEVEPGKPVDLRAAHWNAQTVKAWIRFMERYSSKEDFDRLIQSIKSRRRRE